MSAALSPCALSLSFLLSLSFWPQAKWVPGRAGLPQWRLMFLTQHSLSHLQPYRPLKGRPALRSPDGWWGNLQEQLEEACVYSAPFNEEREGLSLAWISPGTRRRGKKQNRKKKTAAPHVVLPLTTPADFRHKWGREGKGGGEKKGPRCLCISRLHSHPDVPNAKPVGRRKRGLGRGLAGLGWRRWWSNTWPATSMSGRYNSTPHGAVYRMVLSEGKRGLPDLVILAIMFYYCSVLHIILL